MANFTITVDSYANLPISSVDDITEATTYGAAIVVTKAMFIYVDPEGDLAVNLKITSLPNAGFLKLNGTNVTLNQIISFANIDSGLLTYTPDNGDLTAYSTDFTFELADAVNGTFVA